MSLPITARFTESGIPKTGLSPTLDVYEVTDVMTLVKDDVSMTEQVDGYYIYNFSEFNFLKDYQFSFDGTDIMTGSERYLSSSYSGLQELISNIPRGRSGGGSTIYSNMSDKQFEKLVERIIEMLAGVQLDIDTSGIEGKSEEVINKIESVIEAMTTHAKSMKDGSLAMHEDVSKKLLEKVAEIQSPEIIVKEEKVDLSEIQNSLIALAGFIKNMSGKNKQDIEKFIMIHDKTIANLLK